MKTVLRERLGIDFPIIQAPMGGAVGPPLAAAVSNAGGLGMLVPWRADIDTVRRQIREMRALTSRPFGVHLNLEFPQEERLAVCPATVYRLCDEGRLPHVRVLHAIRVTPADLAAFLRKRLGQP